MLLFFEGLNDIVGFNFLSNGLSKKTYLNNFDMFLKTHKFDLSKNIIFLLDESRFSFYSNIIFLKGIKKFTIKDLKSIFETEKQKFYNQTKDKNCKIIVGYTNNIFINGQRSQYIIGQSGDIFFNISFIGLNSTTGNILKYKFGEKVIINKDFFVYPQSFFSLLFFSNSFGKSDFNLLYIKDDICKLVMVKNFFYSDISSISFGKDKFIQILKDNGIKDIYYSKFDYLNPFSEKLYKKSLEFYCDMISKWLKDNLKYSKNIILITDLLKTYSFFDTFEKSFLKYNSGYILPFNGSKNLKTFKNISNNYIDILTTYSLFESKKYGLKN